MNTPDCKPRDLNKWGFPHGPVFSPHFFYLFLLLDEHSGVAHLRTHMTARLQLLVAHEPTRRAPLEVAPVRDPGLVVAVRRLGAGAVASGWFGYFFPPAR